MYVSWVYHKAGFPLGNIDDAKGFRGYQSGYNHWRSTGELTKKPSLGSLIIFLWALLKLEGFKTPEYFILALIAVNFILVVRAYSGMKREKSKKYYPSLIRFVRS